MARALLHLVAVAAATLASAGCDPTVAFRSDEGRLHLRTLGLPPATARNGLGARPSFLAGSLVDLDVDAYCPEGWRGDCDRRAEILRCFEFAVPPDLAPDPSRGASGPALVVPEGTVRIDATVSEACADRSPRIYGDRVTFRGVAADGVTVTFIPHWMSFWFDVLTFARDPRDVVGASEAFVAVPPPSEVDAPIPVAPGSVALEILLRDRAGVPVATETGTANFEVLAGAPEVDAPLGEDPVSWHTADAELSAGDRVAVHLWGNGEPLGVYEIEAVAPEAVVRLEVAAAYLDEVLYEDEGPEGTVVAVAAAYDGAGRLLRGGDVEFVVEGAGFDPEQDRSVGAVMGAPVRPLDDAPSDVRCATVRATLGSQRASTQVCWAPEAEGTGCACRSGGGGTAPPTLLALLLALAALGGRRGATRPGC